MDGREDAGEQITADSHLLTFRILRLWKQVAPIRALIVPKGCFTLRRLTDPRSCPQEFSAP